MQKVISVLAISLLVASGSASAVPMVYSFSGTAGVLIDELRMVAVAGLSPTGYVVYQFVVDTERPSITRDWSGATFEFSGTTSDSRFFATLLSSPYLISNLSDTYYVSGERGQSLDSPGQYAGNIGIEFSGAFDTLLFGDVYNIGIGVSSSENKDVLFENWSVGDFFSGGEAYRTMDGARSAFTATLRLDSIKPYQVDEPVGISLVLVAILALLRRRIRHS